MSGEIAPDHPSRCHVIIQIKRLDMECRAPRLLGMASRTKKAIRGTAAARPGTADRSLAEPMAWRLFSPCHRHLRC